MLKRVGFCVILFCCIMLTACNNVSTTNAKDDVKISWSDIIQFNDIRYISTMRKEEVKLTKDDLDKELYKVKFTLAGNVNELGYKLKNGDASFLPANTGVYSVKGYNSNFCLAAYNKWGDITIYFAYANRNAQKGEELFDIKEKVESISIESHVNQKELALITDPKLIDKMVDMILKAPIDAKRKTSSSESYYIKFNLKKCVSFSCWYIFDGRELSMGIPLPLEFGEIIQKAVEGK